MLKIKCNKVDFPQNNTQYIHYISFVMEEAVIFFSPIVSGCSCSILIIRDPIMTFLQFRVTILSNRRKSTCQPLRLLSNRPKGKKKKRKNISLKIENILLYGIFKEMLQNNLAVTNQSAASVPNCIVLFVLE